MLAVNLQVYMSESDLEQGEIDICSNLSGFLPSARCGMKSSLITSISQIFMPAVQKIKNSHINSREGPIYCAFLSWKALMIIQPP